MSLDPVLQEYYVLSDEKRKLSIISGKEAFNLCNKAMRRFYYRPKYFLRQLYKSFMRKDYNYLKMGMNNFI